jgi:hypothetical protein
MKNGNRQLIIMRFSLIPIGTLLFCLSLTTSSVLARQNIVIGGLTVSIDTSYRKTDDDTGQSTQNKETLNISPLLVIKSTSGRDSIEASFSTGASYDVNNDVHNLNHTASLAAYRYFTRHWQAGFTEAYVRSDDPTLLADTATPLTEEFGRKRYWNNQLNLYTDYAYGKNRNWKLGYLFGVLRNDDTGPDGYENFDLHDLSLEIHHGFTAFWSLSLSGHYIMGYFDPPEGTTDANNVTEHQASLTLTSIPNTRTSYFFSYNYADSHYDASERNNRYLHDLTAGGQYQMSPRTGISYGGGISHEITSSAENWGGNGYLEYSYTFKHSSIQAGVAKGYDLQNFTGTGEQGLVEYRQLSATANYRFADGLAGDISLSWRDEDRDDALNTSPYNQTTYSATTGLSYSFWSWYAARLYYTYSEQRSDLNTDYNEHRIFFSISMQMDMLKS